jgi:predicted metal-dependent hydrolase
MVPGTDDAAAPGVEVRRSRRRRRTVSAYRADDGTVVVLLPARMTKSDEQHWVTTMIGRLERSEARRRPSDAQLTRRAERLSERYLEGLARPASVRWVDNQHQRWGSCTPADRAIRLSRRLEGMPEWVVDYVLLHELAHLLERGHTRTFWRLVDRYPKAERAKGFLEGVASAMRLDVSGDDVCEQVPAASGDEAAAPPQTVTAEIDQLAQ